MMKLPLLTFGCVAILFAMPSTAAIVHYWDILPDKTSIGWTASYGGKPVSGSFPAFTAQIAFDPAQLGASHAAIKIETGKVKSDDKDAQESLPSNDWFAADKFPLAVFESTGFTLSSSNELAAGTTAAPVYQMNGNLTVRDKTVPVALRFTAQFYDDNATSPPTHYARISGETSVKRTALSVGQGDWSATDTIADDVKITIHLEAKQAP